MLGEYAEKINNVDELLSTFLDNFTEDPFIVCVTQSRRSFVLTILLFTGTTTDTYSDSQMLSQETRKCASAGATGSRAGNKELR